MPVATGVDDVAANGLVPVVEGDTVFPVAAGTGLTVDELLGVGEPAADDRAVGAAQVTSPWNHNG